LVVLGVAFGVIGAGLIAAANLLPTSTTQTSAPAGYGPLPPHRSINYVLSGPGGDWGQFSIAWTTSAPAGVALSSARCDATGTSCSPLVSLVRWDAIASGHWATAGSVHFPLLLTFTNNGNATVYFRFSAHEMATVNQGPSLYVLGLADTAGGALIAVGAVAVFLGLFLRPHVYEPPPPPVSISAEDVALLVGNSPNLEEEPAEGPQ
jgi:hypothetical protein